MCHSDLETIEIFKYYKATEEIPNFCHVEGRKRWSESGIILKVVERKSATTFLSAIRKYFRVINHEPERQVSLLNTDKVFS